MMSNVECWISILTFSTAPACRIQQQIFDIQHLTFETSKSMRCQGHYLVSSDDSMEVHGRICLFVVSRSGLISVSDVGLISVSAVAFISVSSVGLFVVAPNDLKTNWILGWQHGNTNNGVSIRGYKISKVFSLRMNVYKGNFSTFKMEWWHGFKICQILTFNIRFWNISVKKN